MPPRNATERRPPPGHVCRWRSKSPTTAWTSTPGTPPRWPPTASRSVASQTSNGDERAAGVPASAERVEEQPCLLGRARTRARRGCRRRSRATMSSARAARIAPLGAGRVVLGQPGDLVEQLRAPVVVEPLRREVLRGPRRARPGRRPRSAVARSSRVEVDVDVQRAASVMRSSSSEGRDGAGSASTTTRERSGMRSQAGSSSSGLGRDDGRRRARRRRCTNSELLPRGRGDPVAVGEEQVQAAGRAGRDHVDRRRERRGRRRAGVERSSVMREQHLGVGVALDGGGAGASDTRGPQLVADAVEVPVDDAVQREQPRAGEERGVVH